MKIQSLSSYPGAGDDFARLTVRKENFKRKLSNTYCWLSKHAKRSSCTEMLMNDHKYTRIPP